MPQVVIAALKAHRTNQLKERLAPLSEDARRKVLGENAWRFYGLAG